MTLEDHLLKAVLNRDQGRALRGNIRTELESTFRAIEDLLGVKAKSDIRVGVALVDRAEESPLLYIAGYDGFSIPPAWGRVYGTEEQRITMQAALAGKHLTEPKETPRYALDEVRKGEKRESAIAIPWRITEENGESSRPVYAVLLVEGVPGNSLAFDDSLMSRLQNVSNAGSRNLYNFIRRAIDVDTGLLTKEFYQRMLLEKYLDAKKRGSNLSITKLDIDDFKAINDGHGGHTAGDRVLNQIGSVLRQEFQADSDLLGRVGGDELERASAYDANRTFMESNIAQARVYGDTVGLQVNGGGLEKGVTFSMGVADRSQLDAFISKTNAKLRPDLSVDEAELEILRHIADLAAYAAKGLRNHIEMDGKRVPEEDRDKKGRVACWVEDPDKLSESERKGLRFAPANYKRGIEVDVGTKGLYFLVSPKFLVHDRR